MAPFNLLRMKKAKVRKTEKGTCQTKTESSYLALAAFSAAFLAALLKAARF